MKKKILFILTISLIIISCKPSEIEKLSIEEQWKNEHNYLNNDIIKYRVLPDNILIGWETPVKNQALEYEKAYFFIGVNINKFDKTEIENLMKTKNPKEIFLQEGFLYSKFEYDLKEEGITKANFEQLCELYDKKIGDLLREVYQMRKGSGGITDFVSPFINYEHVKCYTEENKCYSFIINSIINCPNYFGLKKI